MRANPKFDAATAITELGVGEALVSFLDEKGRPNVVERSMIFPPASRLGPLTADERKAMIQASPLLATYAVSYTHLGVYKRQVSILSLGILTPLALSTATRRRGLKPTSPPPSLAATVISLAILEKAAPRFSSWRPLRCWILDHLE